MIEFVWPQSNGEWLAWISALSLVIFGLWMLFAPARWLASSQVSLQMRGPIGGGSFGLGIAVMVLHPQPLLYLALGSTLLFTAIGRMVWMAMGNGRSKSSWIFLIIEGILAFFSLGYALGLIS